MLTVFQLVATGALALVCLLLALMSAALLVLFGVSVIVALDQTGPRW